jgi:hypothetical protein
MRLIRAEDVQELVYKLLKIGIVKPISATKECELEYVSRSMVNSLPAVFNVEDIVKDLEGASFVLEVDYDFDEEDDGNVECVFLSEAINIVRKGVLKSCTNSLKKIGGDD